MPASPATRVWIVLAVLYGIFFLWYTSLRGPLTPDEIESYVATLRDADLPEERLAVWIRFMESDTGDDFAMLNAIDLRATPAPVPGVEPGESSEEVLARYSRPFLGRAMRGAAHPVLLGRAAAPAVDVWGIDGASEWTNGGVVRYRSRRDVMEQAAALARMGEDNVHAFKIAAMEKTIAYPLDPWFHLGDPRLLLALVFAVIGLAVQAGAASRRERAAEPA